MYDLKGNVFQGLDCPIENYMYPLYFSWALRAYIISECYYKIKDDVIHLGSLAMIICHKIKWEMRFKEMSLLLESGVVFWASI